MPSLPAVLIRCDDRLARNTLLLTSGASVPPPRSSSSLYVRRAHSMIWCHCPHPFRHSVAYYGIKFVGRGSGECCRYIRRRRRSRCTDRQVERPTVDRSDSSHPPSIPNVNCRFSSMHLVSLASCSDSRLSFTTTTVITNAPRLCDAAAWQPVTLGLELRPNSQRTRWPSHDHFTSASWRHSRVLVHW